MKTFSVTVSKRSIITSEASGRSAPSGTTGAHRIVLTATEGTILKNTTTSTSNDQPYRFMGATLYAIVEPGTYVGTQTISSGSMDQQTMVAMVVPCPYDIE